MDDTFLGKTLQILSMLKAVVVLDLRILVKSWFWSQEKIKYKTKSSKIKKWMKAQYIPSYVCIFVSTDLSHNNKSKKAKKAEKSRGE